jgi:flavin-dependent thymidylate synthase
MSERRHEEWCGDATLSRPDDECTCSITPEQQRRTPDEIAKGIVDDALAKRRKKNRSVEDVYATELSDVLPPKPDARIQRWADPAMFAATPLERKEGEMLKPRATLVSMTANPLRVMAAASEMYQGRVVRDPGTVSRSTALEWLDSATKNKLQAPLEFIDLHFLLENVTRAFTHQLVRQRTAVYVQESLRFAVKEDAEFEVALPPSLAGTQGGAPLGAEGDTEEWQRNVWDEAVRHASEAYAHLVNSGVPAEDARGLLPTNIGTRVHYKTNLRNLAEQSGVRLCSQAQHEWKQVWVEMIRAILLYGPESERWQQREIVKLFRPVCFATGKCEFMAPTDRWCIIRDRVQAHAARGDAPDTWNDIDPREPLHALAARRPQ